MNAAPASDASSPAGQRAWFIVGRWQDYQAESRANLLRIIGIFAFYAIELANYYGLKLGWLQIEPIVDERFHRAATALAVAWVMVALAAQLCLSGRVFPSAMKYVSTACDLVLLTAILLLADGPRSPLVVGYFLIIALAALRLRLRLVWCSTLGSIAGYLVLSGYAKWYAPGRNLTVPRYQQFMFLLALALTGVILGQLVRSVRRMADEFAQRLARAQRGEP